MKICFWNGQQICFSEKTRDIKLYGHVWVDAPANFNPLKVYKLSEGTVEEVSLVEYDPSRLRVHRVLPLGQNALISDFTILGFKKESPSYNRGRKTQSLYLSEEENDLIVKKMFTDIRDSAGTLTALQVKFDFYSEDGTVGVTKTEVVKRYNKYEAETEERKRRERQIDYLVAGAKGTPIEANINAVFDFLYEEVLIYKEKANSQPLVDKINQVQFNPNTTDPVELEMNGLWYVLNAIPIPRVDDSTKFIYVAQSIKYQIGALTLVEIEESNETA